MCSQACPWCFRACWCHCQACRWCSLACRRPPQDCSPHIQAGRRCPWACSRCFQTCFLCSQACHWQSKCCRWESQVLLALSTALPSLSRECHVHLGQPDGHCLSIVNSGILPPSDSGPTTLKYSLWFIDAKLNLADLWCSEMTSGL